MDNKVVIDGVVRLLERGDNLPTCPSWLSLREEMAHCQLFSLEELDQSKEYIIEKFYQLRVEHVQQEMANLIGRPITPNDSTDSSSTVRKLPSSQGSNKDSGFNGSCKGSESDEEGGFQPTVIKTMNDETFTFMSVCLNGIWEGAALEYCREDESFISPRWVQRHSLEMVDGQIRLTWKFAGDDKTHLTQFILLENLEPDFMLGVKSSDELFNRESGVPRSPGPSHDLLDLSALPMEHTSTTQVWISQSVPNTEFISDILFRLEKKYRSDIAGPNQFCLPQQPGGMIEEDSKSRSNASSDPNRGGENPAHISSSLRSHPKPL